MEVTLSGMKIVTNLIKEDENWSYNPGEKSCESLDTKKWQSILINMCL